MEVIKVLSAVYIIQLVIQDDFTCPGIFVGGFLPSGSSWQHNLERTWI